jgi:hypothetical protein
MIKAIRDYFLKYKKFPKSSLLNVDALTDNVNDFSIDIVPSNPVVESYLDGTTLKQITFVLAGRFAYNNDNTKILNFFDDLSSWIKTNNDNGILPELEFPRISEQMNVLSNGYLINQLGTEAKYQIQLRLLYRERSE